MAFLLNFAIGVLTFALQVVSTLDLSAATPFTIYQPKTPKSMLR